MTLNINVIFFFIKKKKKDDEYLPYITNNSQLRKRVENDEPDADILTAFRHGTPRLTYKLVRVQSDLDPVVQQREERSQWERSNKYSDESKL